MTVHTSPAGTAADGDVPPASDPAPSGDRHPVVEAIRAHHARLGRTMADHTLTIQDSIDRLSSPSQRQATLAAFCAGEILPHAMAEEETLYRAGAELPGTRLLVQAMTREHTILRDLAERLETARTPGEALAAAAALNALFQAHLEKENDVLLPALVEAGVDLAALLAGMHAILGDSRGHSDTRPETTEGTPEGKGTTEGTASPADGGPCGGHSCACGHDRGEYDESATAKVVDGELDVRPLAPAQRHERIFGTFDALPTGTAFVLVNDHDPKPLSYQFAAEHPGEFTWDYLETGPRVWRVRIGRP